MTIPAILHPVQVKFRVRRTDLTLMDDDAREPVGKVNRNAEVTLTGQIFWQNKVWESEAVGLVPKTLGYVLLRRYDLTAVGVNITEGDKIIQIGINNAALTEPYYIYRIMYRGHYQDTDGHSLVKVWFTDKKPSRQN